MGFFDLFLNRNKRSFSSIKKNEKVSILSDEDIKKAIQNSNEPTVKMFSSIFKYNDKKNQLIEKGCFSEFELPKTEIISIINEFFENIISSLPTGLIIPIETSLIINGQQQSLLIGKDLIFMGKYKLDGTDKLKTGLKKQEEVAVLLDKNKITNYEDFKSNIRIAVEDEDHFINLSKENFLSENWSVCRFSIIELNFENCLDSRTHVLTLQDGDIASTILKNLPNIEEGITKSITAFIDKKTEFLSNTLNKHTNNAQLNNENNLNNKDEEAREDNKVKNDDKGVEEHNTNLSEDNLKESDRDNDIDV